MFYAKLPPTLAAIIIQSTTQQMMIIIFFYMIGLRFRSKPRYKQGIRQRVHAARGAEEETGQLNVRNITTTLPTGIQFNVKPLVHCVFLYLLFSTMSTDNQTQCHCALMQISRFTDFCINLRWEGKHMQHKAHNGTHCMHHSID